MDFERHRTNIRAKDTGGFNMKLIGVINTALLFLLLGIVSATEARQDQQEKEKPKQENFQPQEMSFFLTSPFIELIGT
jgi:hypothetical protein